ncbi:MAG: hypothetical protein L0229_11355 [Blastocatellia bacterium]|nr:hypothetical protein [Blastocatellia bacterium]
MSWHARWSPLAPVGAAARGPFARRLALRLLACDDERLSRLKGVAGPSMLIVLGEEYALPWVDGVTYLGRDPEAPQLLLPTSLRPSVAPALLERALLRKIDIMSRASSSPRSLFQPLAVFVDPPVIAPVGHARTVARDTLGAWLDAEK